MTNLTLAALAALMLAGCANGVQQMTAEQLKALDGLAACSYYQGMYGKVGTVIVSPDSVRKGSTSKAKITIAPDSGCAVTIEGDVGVGAAPLR